MLIGYARVSTQDQNLELQREALTRAGCQKVFEDKVSGTRADRPGLARALEMLREGDTLVVWKLDRLGRSVKQLVDLVGALHKQDVQFRSLTDAIDTGTPSGRFFFHVMASLAEMERELTVERTRAGLEVARQLGRKGGRKPKMTDSKIESAKKLLASGVPPKDVAKNLGVAVPLDTGFSTRLACFKFRFLRRSHDGRRPHDGLAGLLELASGTESTASVHDGQVHGDAADDDGPHDVAPTLHGDAAS
ncbi:Site-specific DNA recombinase [Azotobacter beijerinckii]|uniref:Site-specific DNA recombinase n=1 Tax=Azotobacter beijerinckii TaxID=170623 RepID=A0A1H9RIF6_9GAMM|nr:Site-specific DNA recombinase [Azotobacter beijerinckii]